MFKWTYKKYIYEEKMVSSEVSFQFFSASFILHILSDLTSSHVYLSFNTKVP